MNILTIALFLSLGKSPEIQELTKLSRSICSNNKVIKVGGGLCGGVIAFGENSQVLATSKQGIPIIVGAIYGKGRVIAMSHEALLSTPGNESFMRDLLSWVNPPGKPIGLGGRAFVHSSFGNPVPVTIDKNFNTALSKCGTLVFSQAPLDGDLTRQEQVTKFVQEGGGLVIAGPAWGWMQLNPGKNFVKDHSGQRILSNFGLGFSEGTVDSENGDIKLASPRPENNVLTALAIFKGKEIVAGDAAKTIGYTLESALGSLPIEHPILKDIRNELSDNQLQIRPTKKSPILSSNYKLRLAARYYDREWRNLPPEKVTAHPSSLDFPGSVRASKRQDFTVSIGGRKREWWSTGAYAAPGEVIQVELPKSLWNLKVNLQIGGQTDNLWHLESWERFPSITNETKFSEGIARLANPFGGLVYILAGDVPLSTIKLKHVVAAPVFVSGNTTDSQWNALQKSDAPWGEIIGKQSAISVPSSVLRTLKNPQEVATYWDEVVQQVELFYAVPKGSREERYQVDRQISAGYMHSGYPIMTWEDVAAKFVDIKILRGDNGDTNWGFYHEIGHNFQVDSWTLDEWGETTNNLYSLFGTEHFNRDLTGGHGAMQRGEREKRMAIVKANPGKEAYYAKDPWFGLTMLYAIREEFGWEPFQKLFAQYRTLNSIELPKNEVEKQDQLLVRLSKILGKDLGSYCQAWGFKNSAKAKQEASQYQIWWPK